MKRFPVLLAVSAMTVFSWVVLTSSQTFASAHHMFEDEAAAAGGSSNDKSGGWNQSNNPSSWSTQYNYQLNELPLQGRVQSHQPWSDTYWPTRNAGIASRWNWGSESNGFRYYTFNEAQVRAMSIEDLKRLSPAEKYDIFMGRFDYPTVRGIRGSTSPRAEYWSGICHGWSPAALNHAEPAAVTVAGPSGILVPFGSADVKGLMDQYYADNARASTFLGLKCQAGNGGNIFRRIASPFLNGASCDDVNAGALHVILTNELGIKHQGFVADIERMREVWNQPVFAYTSVLQGTRAPNRDSAPGTDHVVVVHTEMFYADELEVQSFEPVVGTPAYKQGVERYDYTVEIDSSGRIIGGQWISANRPDFLWNATKLQFTGYSEGINAIYRPAQR